MFGLQARGLDPGQWPQDRIEAMATSCLEEIRDVQPRGPYLLAGWSMGGLIALEAAQQLLAIGQETALVVMFDTHLSLHDFQYEVDDHSVLMQVAPRLNIPIEQLKGLPIEQKWQRIAEMADKAEGMGIAEIRRLAAACKAHLAAIARYEPRPYPGHAVLFTAQGGRRRKTAAGRPSALDYASNPRLAITSACCASPT